MSGYLLRNVWLVPMLPLLGAAITACSGRWLKGRAHLPVVIGILLSCAISLLLLWGVPVAHHAAVTEKAGAEATAIEKAGSAPDAAGTEAADPSHAYSSYDPSRRVMVYRWIDAGDLHVPVEFRVDGLSTMMISMVTFIALIIAVFSIGYMAHDPGYSRFFAEFGLFVFSMTGLVLSNNFVLTYAFWEGVGLCSYLLIGFWYYKPSASAAAMKAMLVNRIGDFGFAIALLWLWTVVPDHDLSYDNVLSLTAVGRIQQSALLGISLLLFWAATAKSAQIPLYVWLPDAMEGPTPVSALIHAATMVTAGVYLIARSSILVMNQPLVLLVIAIVGCATALLAAAIAVTQTDLKRVLAYSTVSQLGFMFMGLGAGVGDVQRLALVAGMFHLFTHAFFKALLFLGSGSVMHAMGHVIDMRRFSGLRHRMPLTCWTFAIGGLSLAGIAPLAGFWSKDEILAALKLAAHAAEPEGLTWGGVYTGIYWAALFTALLTAFYTGRAFFLTFFGPLKLPSRDDPGASADEHLPDPGDAHDHAHAAANHSHGHGHDHAADAHFGHESPLVMTLPLIVLAVGTVVVGMLFGPLTHYFEHHVIDGSLGFERLRFAEHATDWTSIWLGSAAGLLGLGASALLYARPSGVPASLARSLKPLYIASYEKFHVDEFYDALVIKPTKALAAISRFLDEYLVDGLVRLAAWTPRFVGRDMLAPLQGGLVQLYAWTTLFGLLILLLFMLFW